MYDNIIAQLKKVENRDGPITEKDLPPINPFKINEMIGQTLSIVNRVEKYPSIYPGKDKK